MKKIIAMALMMSVSATFAETVIFGSDNDGLGGWTHTAVNDSSTFLTTGTDSVSYRNQDLGTQNSSFLGQYAIDRSIGSEVWMSGTVTLNSFYADDNNRIGFYLFGDSAQIPDQLEAGAIGVIFNTDDNSASATSFDNNAQDNFSFRVGIDAGIISDNGIINELGYVAPKRNQSDTSYAQNLWGTDITFSTILRFVDDGLGGTNINIQAWMFEESGAGTVIETTVAATNYTGDYFGFVSRARARNYDGDPDPTGAARDAPLVMDYQSFQIIPEPATVGMFGLFGGALLLIRRRLARR